MVVDTRLTQGILNIKTLNFGLYYHNSQSRKSFITLVLGSIYVNHWNIFSKFPRQVREDGTLLRHCSTVGYLFSRSEMVRDLDDHGTTT